MKPKNNQSNMMSSIKSSIAASLTAKKSTATTRPKSAVKSYAKPTASRAAKADGPSGDTRMGPGTYDVKGKNFGEDTKGFKIGRKREPRQEHSPNPYPKAAEQASKQKHRSPSTDFSKQEGRKESPARDDPEAPQPERFYNYPKEIPNFSIGEKRPEKPRDGPGPGEYSLDNSATKPRVRGYH